MHRSHCIDKNLETLDKLDHVAALVMRIEHAQQPQDLAQVLVRLKEKLAHEHELREDIRNWALAAIGNRSSIAAELLDEFAKPEGTVMNLEEKWHSPKSLDIFITQFDAGARTHGG